MTSDRRGRPEDGRAPTEELSCVRDGTSDRRGRPSTGRVRQKRLELACGRQKERALTSPKTSALAFISVLPWRINDGADTKLLPQTVGCITLVKPLRGCDKSFSKLS
jgi:hypothetical protein